jgi:pyrimidine operon attenuation protein / uracil phosphoribosyltransferase
MESERLILEQPQFNLVVERLCHQLIETFDDFSTACIVSIQPRGTLLANRLVTRLHELGVPKFPYGKMDITFYRDDFRRGKTLAASYNEMNFLVENLHVVLVDDVLYTGRSVQAALTAVNHYGRPASVNLVTLIDRRYNRHLPIQANFKGLAIDSLDDEYVKVLWQEETQKDDKVVLYPRKA